MPKHSKKTKHLEDYAPAVVGQPEVHELTSSDEEMEAQWASLAPIVTQLDTDVLEINVEEDRLEEMEIDFEKPRKRDPLVDETIEGLIGDAGRLALKDDIDREKFGWEKLMKAPNNMKLLHDGKLL